MRVLDVCCGSRMFWFDREDKRGVFCDNRRESFALKDASSVGGERALTITPDVQCDFTRLPFSDNSFSMVVFDPPHLESVGKASWLRAKYGALECDWRGMLRSGFSEAFRVLSPGGALIFKWSSIQIPLAEVLKLTKERPLFGHKSGRHSLTHWVSFLKTSP